ncbi:MAG: hypothetical protein CSA64_04555 [Arachnia propionica]|nr:MAG: hypothetical protein CSA64_04555 [Arachnia propionica]
MKPYAKKLVILLLVPLVLLTTGCLRFKMNLDVKSHDEVAIAFDSGILKEFVTELGADAPTKESLCENADIPAGVDNLKSEPYEDEEYIGCRVTATARVASLATADGPQLTLEDGIWTFRMSGENMDAQGEAITSEMITDFEVKVTFPGKVIEASEGGEITGNTVVWSNPTALFSGTGLYAQGEDGIAGLPGWLLPVIALIVLLLIVVIVAIVLLQRKKKGQAQPSQQYPAGPYPQQPYPQQPYPQQPQASQGQQPYPPQSQPQYQPYPQQAAQPPASPIVPPEPPQYQSEPYPQYQSEAPQYQPESPIVPPEPPQYQSEPYPQYQPEPPQYQSEPYPQGYPTDSSAVIADAAAQSPEPPVEADGLPPVVPPESTPPTD